MWFADRNNAPLDKQSEETFSRAISELERTILSGSQHTFWGTPAYQSELHDRRFTHAEIHRCIARFPISDCCVRRQGGSSARRSIRVRTGLKTFLTEPHICDFVLVKSQEMTDLVPHRT